MYIFIHIKLAQYMIVQLQIEISTQNKCTEVSELDVASDQLSVVMLFLVPFTYIRQAKDSMM